MARTTSVTFQQQASRAFGRLVRGINDAQLRALMRAVFYRADRYQAFCRAPLAVTGVDATAGSAIRHAIRIGRLMRAVAGSFLPQERDLMLAAALLMGVGAVEAFEAQKGSLSLTTRGRLYPIAVLSALIVHDERCTIDRRKREALEGLILQAAWAAGEPGVPAPETTCADDFSQHRARVVALCVQLDRFAAAQPCALAVRWSLPASKTEASQRDVARSSRTAASHLTLVGSLRKDDDDARDESRLAAG